jgi:hypothetical protein
MKLFRFIVRVKKSFADSFFCDTAAILDLVEGEVVLLFEGPF